MGTVGWSTAISKTVHHRMTQRGEENWYNYQIKLLLCFHQNDVCCLSKCLPFILYYYPYHVVHEVPLSGIDLVPEMCWLQMLGEKLAGCLSSRSWFSLSSRGKAICWSKPMTFTVGLCTLHWTRPYSLYQKFPQSSAWTNKKNRGCLEWHREK